MNGLHDFVAGGFPLPWMPVFDGMGEFVGGGFPLPQNPVYFASAKGSLPKAPDMPMALIAHGNGADTGMGDCGCGGSCGGCGMGDIAVPTWASSLPSPLNGSSTWPLLGVFPNVYVVLGVAALIFFVGAPFVARDARRRR